MKLYGRTPHARPAPGELQKLLAGMFDGPKRTYVTNTFENGIVKLSETITASPTVANDLCQPSSGWTLSWAWRDLDELQDVVGWQRATDVLVSAGLFPLSRTKETELREELRAKLPAEVWDVLEHVMDNAGDEFVRQITIVAAWADQCAEKLSDVWLAAMALHAACDPHGAFAFGYLTAQLEARANSEADYLRGKKITQSSKAGGQARKRQLAHVSGAVLLAMSGLLARGHSVRRAGQIAFEKGIGKSAEANRKIWSRRSHKNGTPPANVP